MIPVSVFNMLIGVILLLFVYSLIDLNNRIYGNIIAAFLGTLVAGYTAVIANTGIVQSNGTVMADLSLQIILIIVTASMMIYTAYMAWDAYQEAQEVKNEI